MCVWEMNTATLQFRQVRGEESEALIGSCMGGQWGPGRHAWSYIQLLCKSRSPRSVSRTQALSCPGLIVLALQLVLT